MEKTNVNSAFSRGCELQWVERDVERRLLALVGTCSFIHVRGRRRTGKTATIKRVQRRCNRKHIFVSLPETGGISLIVDEFSSAGISLESHPTHEADLIALLLKALREGVIIALDEIQRANSTLQWVLQVVIDEINDDLMREDCDTSAYGSLIVLGSMPVLVDEVLEGAGRPLYGRFTHRLQVLPFWANELSSIFHHYGITNGSTMLAIYAATGGVPGLLNCLSVAELLVDGTSLHDMLHALYATSQQLHTTAMSSFHEAEFSLHHRAIQYVSTRGKGKSVSEQIADLQQILNDDRSMIAASTMLQTLSLHGIITKLGPICPSVCSMAASKAASASESVNDIAHNTYAVDDPALQTFHELKIAPSGDYNVGGVTTINTFATDIALTEGYRLARWVRAILVQRHAAGYFAIPTMPDLTKPSVIRGLWAGFRDTEIDVVAVFHAEKVVVCIIVMRDADEAIASLHDTKGNKNLHQTTVRLREHLEHARRAGFVLSEEEIGILEYEMRFLGITASLTDKHHEKACQAMFSESSLGVQSRTLLDLPQLLTFDSSKRWKRHSSVEFPSEDARKSSRNSVERSDGPRVSNNTFNAVITAVVALSVVVVVQAVFFDLQGRVRKAKM